MRIQPTLCRFHHTNTMDKKVDKAKPGGEKETGGRDIYTKGDPINKLTYEKSVTKTDSFSLEKLKEESDRAYSTLRKLVEKLLESQGRNYLDSCKKSELDQPSKMEAARLVAEAGPLGAEAVSDRIVDFAKAISGGDKSKLDELIKAIDQGFREAARVLGGLPEVSLKTYDLIMQKLDKWLQEG